MPDQPDIPRPARPNFDASKIPAQLRVLPQWAAWKYVWKDDAWAKLPIDVRLGTAARSNDPNTWSSFDDALTFFQESDDLDGLMFCITEGDEFVGIDIDRCIDASGTIAVEAAQLLREFNTYSEVSPSGTGVKLWITGKKNHIRCKSKALAGVKEVEVYDRARFFTLTGAQLPNCPSTIERCQKELDGLCVRLWPPQPVPARPMLTGGANLDDDTLIKKALSAKNGDKFRRLMAGDTSAHGNDDSAADLSFCNSLAYWTGKNASQMDRIFRTSGLFRSKWDSRRGTGTYGSKTIDKAIADCVEVYSPKPQSTPVPTANNEGGIAGTVDPASGRLILDPQRTVTTAKVFLQEFYDHPDCCRLVYQDEQLYEWRDNRYVPIESTTLKQSIHRWLHEALAIHINFRTGATTLVPFRANPKSVQSVFEAVCFESHLPHSPASVFWRNDDGRRPSTNEILCCKTKILHVASGRCIAATPALFNKGALEFDFDPDAPEPTKFLWFLNLIFGPDKEMLLLILEVMGYFLCPDNSLQKIVLFQGPPRAGKGLLGELIQLLVGAENVGSVTIDGLTQHFAMQSCYDKPVAIVWDAKYTSKKLDVALELLLTISGGGAVSVDRKYLSHLNTRVPTRFLIISNPLPVFHDSSNALTGRLVIVRFTKSFLGKEDTELLDKFRPELPGILNLAIKGMQRLRANKAFTEPSSNASLVGHIRELNSPVKSFVDECCTLDPLSRVAKAELYAGWSEWCARKGSKPCTDAVFGKDLAIACPEVTTARAKVDAVTRVNFYVGIAMKDGES